MAKLDGDRLTVCLSDDFRSFRKEQIDPSYKSNRGGTERPLELYALKDWLAATYPTQRRPRLEADDVMGIMATDPSSTEERIIVSQDKDMKTIPGLLYRPFDENPEVQEISLIEADRFHLWQTIVGDAVDGYPGCPGAGPVAADKALDLFQGVGPIHREITRGPRKGTIVTTWEAREFDTAWEALVSLYHKAGQGEADAIRQARLARILRFDEYDGRPILWTPPRAN